MCFYIVLFFKIFLIDDCLLIIQSVWIYIILSSVVQVRDCYIYLFNGMKCYRLRKNQLMKYIYVYIDLLVLILIKYNKEIRLLLIYFFIGFYYGM